VVRGAKLLLLKNTITMQKFLTTTLTNGEKRIIPIHKFVSIYASTNTQVKINLDAPSGYDTISITLSAADPKWIAEGDVGIGSMVDVLSQLIIKAFAQGNWSDPFLDITGSVPIPLQSIIVSTS
tara:strand:- start:360 stop:731 length:372 start_codon:yes stop_codon:yes gene_type:complete